VFRLTSASTDELGHILRLARAGGPTYTEVGATKSVELPTGYRQDRRTRVLGSPVDFDRARGGLRLWQAHEGAGARVFPASTIVEGETVLVVLGLGPLEVIAPCRIVYVLDEPDRFGFAYGTLPGHPECGEESFVVERDEQGTTFHVTAFSRPAQFVARVGGPATRLVQLRVTRRYLEALARYVSHATD
jgi:uncharacterized protein (UPF0548 family)